MTGASRGLEGFGVRPWLCTPSGMRRNRPYQDRQPRHSLGLNGGGGQRRAGVDGITKTRRDRPDSTSWRGEARAEAGDNQATGQVSRGSTKCAWQRAAGWALRPPGRSFRPAAERRTGIVAAEHDRDFLGRSACKSPASALHHGALHVAPARVFQNLVDVSLHTVHDPLAAEISHLLRVGVLSKSAGTLAPEARQDCTGKRLEKAVVLATEYNLKCTV